MLEAGIVTPAADRLLDFYLDGLGFEVVTTMTFPQGTVHRLRRGDARVKLYQPSGGTRVVPRPRPWHAADGFAYACLHVDDLDHELDRVVRAGAEVLDGPTNHRPGARFALVADPEGNVWELLEEAADAPA